MILPILSGTIMEIRGIRYVVILSESTLFKVAPVESLAV